MTLTDVACNDSCDREKVVVVVVSLYDDVVDVTSLPALDVVAISEFGGCYMVPCAYA